MVSGSVRQTCTMMIDHVHASDDPARMVAACNATVRTLPRESQALLGHSLHDGLAIGGGYLGAVDLRDPVELLGSGAL